MSIEKIFDPIVMAYYKNKAAGGGGGVVSQKDVNFVDYRGKTLYSYSLKEIQAMSELPELPNEKGLICQGWNWTLDGIKAMNRPVTVGAMYITDDGKTRIYITLLEGRTSPMLGVCPNGTVTVDWGDGSEPDVLTGTSTSTVQWTPTHNYAKPGDYVIELTVDGAMGFYGQGGSNTYSGILRHANGADARNTVYQNAVKKIEIGNGVASISSYAFSCCYSLASMTIPKEVTSIGNYAFSACYSLAGIIIPEGVTSIGNNAFYSCYSLASITIPEGVTSIGSNAFNSCQGVRYYDFTSCTIVPTLSNTNAFDGIPADCKILVPAVLYDEWISATNWTTYADYIVAV